MGLLGPHNSHDSSRPPHTRPLDMAAQSLPEVCQSGSPREWSCGHRPPLVTGSEFHKGLYTSHSADYSVSGPLSLLEPQYGFFQFVPHSFSVGKVVQKFIIIPIFLRKLRLREGAGLTWGHTACYWWCSSQNSLQLISFIFPVEESFSDYMKIVSYLFKKTPRQFRKVKRGRQEFLMWLYHCGSCLSSQRCSCILCMRVHVLFFFFFFFLQNEHVLCQLFSPYNMYIFLCQNSRCRSSF